MNHSPVKPQTLMVKNITNHNNIWFDRGVVHIVVAGYIVDHYCSMFHRGVVHNVVVGYIVDHYCFMFDGGVVHIVVAVILLPCQTSNINGQKYHQSQQCMNHSPVKPQTVLGNNIASHNNINTPLSNLKQCWSTL
jgi:hypothetical protein